MSSLYFKLPVNDCDFLHLSRRDNAISGTPPYLSTIVLHFKILRFSIILGNSQKELWDRYLFILSVVLATVSHHWWITYIFTESFRAKKNYQKSALFGKVYETCGLGHLELPFIHIYIFTYMKYLNKYVYKLKLKL